MSLSKRDIDGLWRPTFLENDKMALNIWTQWLSRLQNMISNGGMEADTLSLREFLEKLYSPQKIESTTSTSVFSQSNEIQSHHLNIMFSHD